MLQASLYSWPGIAFQYFFLIRGFARDYVETWPGIVFQCFFLIRGLHSVATLPLFYYSPVIFDIVHRMLLPFHVATLIV